MDILKIIFQGVEAITGLLLIVFVLLHSPKGDGIGAIGGTAQLFSSQKGAESTLNKTTAWIAGIFYLAAFVLGYYF